MIRVSQRAFDRLVADALDRLPEHILRMLENIAVVVADAPTAEQRQRMRLRDNEDLLGLYEGVPRTERGGYAPVLPDKVTIFQRPIEAYCATEEELVETVRHTVIHELAHHLGINDARLIEIGYEAEDDEDE